MNATTSASASTPPTTSPVSTPVSISSTPNSPSPSTNPPSSSSPSPSSNSLPSSSNNVPQTTTSEPVFLSTSVVTQSGSSAVQPTTIIKTITSSGATVTQSIPPSGTSSAAATSSSSGAISPTNNGASGGSSTQPGTIAAAVVVPVVAVALIILAGIFFWKKRKQRKEAEEARKKEMEEYSYNPNNDPTIPAVGSTDGDAAEQDVGYRGWGNTSAATRKASTTLSSGMARSDSGGNAYRGQYSPSGATAQNSESHSGDPLMDQNVGNAEPVGALGAAPVSANRGTSVNRGPSNASSAYSGGANRSDTSGEGPPVNVGSPTYYNDFMYADGGMPHDPGDGAWSGQPVIKEVSARRNTRIENPTVFPQQGNSGISQNF